MVHRSRARSSSLFLMELILAILFFSVASGVCVEFFVKSHLLSRESNLLTHAVNECSGVAEVICTSDSLADGLQLLYQQYPEGDYPDLDTLDSTAAEDDSAESADDKTEVDIRLYYDDAFAPCKPDAAEYILDIHLKEEEQMIEAVLEMSNHSGAEEEVGAIYHLETKHHIPRKTAS